MAETLTPFGLPTDAVAGLKAVLARHPHVSSVVLFGSRAKGTHRPASDIDLTLVGDLLSTPELLRIADEMDDLDLPYHVDLSLFNDIEDAALREHIARVGRIFYAAA